MRVAAALLALALAAPALRARAANCDPWPGEPTPLPALDDPDTLRAEWAELRVRELAGVAKRVEGSDPLRARQLWRRILCIDPGDDEALAGVLRSQAVRLHRPALIDAPFEAVTAGDPWEALGTPIGLCASGGGGDPAQLAAWRDLRGEVTSLEDQVRAARFDEALETAPALRSRLSRAPVGRARSQMIAQVEVLAATAELAVGRGAAAEGSLRRALAADPDLSLDPTTTSPKVLRALQSARGGAGQ